MILIKCAPLARLFAFRWTIHQTSWPRSRVIATVRKLWPLLALLSWDGMAWVGWGFGWLLMDVVQVVTDSEEQRLLRTRMFLSSVLVCQSEVRKGFTVFIRTLSHSLKFLNDSTLGIRIKFATNERWWFRDNRSLLQLGANSIYAHHEIRDNTWKPDFRIVVCPTNRRCIEWAIQLCVKRLDFDVILCKISPPVPPQNRGRSIRQEMGSRSDDLLVFFPKWPARPAQWLKPDNLLCVRPTLNVRLCESRSSVGSALGSQLSIWPVSEKSPVRFRLVLPTLGCIMCNLLLHPG